MPRHTLPRALAIITVAGLASHASAELPGVLDLIPAGSMAGVVAPSLSAMDLQTVNLFTSVGMPVLMTPSQMFAQAGFANGIDMERSIGVAIVPGPMDGDEPPMAIFLPTTDANAFLNQFDAEDIGGGVFSFDMDKDHIFAKPIGNGYLILGPMEDVISGFQPQAGNKAAHSKMMGSNAMAAAEASMAFGFVNLAALEPMMADKWDEFREEAAEGFAEGMAQNPMANITDEQIEEMSGQLVDLAEQMVNDGMYGVMGLQVGSMGIGAQFAVDFEPGSESANMFHKTGDSGSLLAKLPAQPFIFASAFDMTCGGTAELMEFAKSMQAMTGMGEDQMHGLMGMIDNATGGASALYPSQGGLMGGLFTGMVNYTRVSNAGEYLDRMGELAEGGAAMAPSLTRNETQIDGHSVHGWSMSMPMDPNNPAAMQMMQVSQMLFGGQMMQGYMVESDGGIYQTMSKNAAVVQSVLNRGNDTLAGSAAIAQVREFLPGPAAAEGYFGFGAVYDMVSPFAAMMGMQIQTAVPADLPPIGASIAVGNGGMRSGFFAPAPVLRVGANLAMEIQASMPANNGWEEEEEGDDAPF